MQDQENGIAATESSADQEPNLKAEPIEIFPETEETISEEETLSPSDEGTGQPKAKTPSRRLFRKFIRWAAGLLIVFGLGFLTAIFTLYSTTVDELESSQHALNTAEETMSDLEAQIVAQQDQIEQLNDQIETLNQEIEDLESQNQNLLDEQENFNLHIALLKARGDVLSAQVELYDENPAQARILLLKTDETLTTIASMLPEEAKDAVIRLRARLDLILTEINADPETAIKDLGIVAGDLLEIENALFGK